MTVITALITGRFTVHATDSFLTIPRGDGTYETVETQGTKIVRVPPWRGAMSYFGLARLADGWNTLSWLQAQAGLAASFGSAEAFALHIGTALQAEIDRRRFQSPTHCGIGIHFTAYEYVGGYRIPELFMISNWETPSYSSLRPNGIGVTREVYGSLKNLPDRHPSHGDLAARLEVHSILHTPYQMTWFNNGAPGLFNPTSDLVLYIAQYLQDRNHLQIETVQAHAALARRPVEILSGLLTSFTKPGGRQIGGKPHDLAIAPDGTYWSSTGD